MNKYSIIIPAYNSEKYIQESVYSIIDQEYKHWEIVIVDDGSTDKTGKIVDGLAKKYPQKIRVLHQKNSGQLAARSAGIEHASGNYLCFLDSDDLFNKNALSTIDSVLEKNDIDILNFKWEKFGINIKKSISDSIFPSEGFINKADIVMKIASTSFYNSMCLKVIKRELYEHIDYNKNSFMIRNGEDLLQLLSLIKNAKSFYYLDKCLYRYRQHSFSTTHSFNKKSYMRLEQVRGGVYQFLISSEFNTTEYIQSFFRYFFEVLLNDIKVLSINIKNKKEIIDEFEIIQSFNIVQIAKNNLCFAHPKIRHQVLLFYNRRYFLVIIKMRIMKLFGGLLSILSINHSR